MKILIIEDDPVSLRLTSEVLQGGGHVVVLATSADQAIASINAVKPDAIFLDLRLQGIYGEAVARQCRENPVTHDIPIIAVSAFPAGHSREGARQAGCDAYIDKPIDTRTLLRQVEEIVAAKAAGRFATAEIEKP